MGKTYNEGLQTITSLGVISMPLMFITPFYKSLADRFGRKVFLVINTAGMALSLLIGYLSANVIWYIIGMVIGSFFVMHDMQVVYIMEAAPSDKRARFYGITKCVGTLGLVLVPFLRDVYMGNDPTKWRDIFFLPMLLGIILVIVSIVFARETPTFLEQRIKYLEIPYEERQAKKAEAKAAKKVDSHKAGVFHALKYCFSSKQLRWLCIGIVIYYFVAPILSQYYESIMTTSGMSVEAVTKALYVFPFVFAGVIFICGFLGDFLGRKITVVLMGSISIATFILFVISCSNGWSPYLIGLLYGLYLSCFYQGGDYLIVIATESAPTEIRSSVLGALALPQLVSTFSGTVIGMVLMGIFSISTTCLVMAVPCITISTVIIITKVRETKGVDLNTIKDN